MPSNVGLYSRHSVIMRKTLFKFCGECGTKMPEAAETIKCPTCGADVEGKFCGQCGTKVRD